MSRRSKNAPVLHEERVFLDHFYQKYRRFLYYIARSYTKDPNECEDIVQDAMVRLIRNLPKIMSLDESGLRGYVSATVRTVFLDHARKKRKALFLEDELLDILLEKERKSVPDPSSCWEMELLKRELSPREWLALEGKYILGYSREELGALLGVTPDSVRMLLCRAREKARRILCAGSLTGGGGDD